MKKTEIQKLEAKLNKLWKLKCDERYNTDTCEACGDQFSAYHHWIPKSRSILLRYNVENAIPLCVKCHYKIHNSSKPTEVQRICNTIESIRGKKWLKYIKDRENISIKKNILWLKEQEAILIGD